MPSYEIPTCQQVHIGYSFTFCSSWHQLLWGRSKSQGMDYVLNLLITKRIWSHVIWKMLFLQASNQGKKSEKCLMFSVKHCLKTWLSWCHQCYQHNLLQNSFPGAAIITLTHLQGLRCSAAKYMRVAKPKRKHRKDCKISQLCLHLFLGRLHSLVMLCLSHILLSATTDMSHALSFLVSKNATTAHFKSIANFSQISLKIL